MTFSIDVKELPAKCLKDPYFSSLEHCYLAYEYNLKNTKYFGFVTDFKSFKNSFSGSWENKEIDYIINNKYSKLIISTFLKNHCTININKNASILHCYDHKVGSQTLLIKCEPSGVLIVENNKGYSSASVNYDELTPLIKLGFFQSVPLICPDILGDDSAHAIDHEL
jgi:hypothetical protein